MRGYPASGHLSGFLCHMQVLLMTSLLVGQTSLELIFLLASGNLVLGMKIQGLNS